MTYLVGAKSAVPTLIDLCKKIGVAGVDLRTTHAHGVTCGQAAEAAHSVRSVSGLVNRGAEVCGR